MIYSEFKARILSEVKSRVDRSCTVSLHEVVKNNSTILDGLMIENPLVNITPTIYLNPYYHRFLDGVTISDIVEDIMNTYEVHAPTFSINVDFFTDFENIRPKVIMKLISREKNQALLQDLPHKLWQDLAVIFQFMLENPAVGGSGTITIHNDYLDMWGVTEKDLYEAALKNTPRLLPFELINIVQCIDLLLKENQPDSMPCPGELSPEDTAIPMYVLTNQARSNGASTVLYPHLLEKIADSFECDLVLLPSSIHEFIIVPAGAARTDLMWDSFNDMVETINETEVADEEILSDHAYYYRRENGQIFTSPASKHDGKIMIS